MKKAQIEYNSKGKNASWDANRLVRESLLSRLEIFRSE